jgi:hypothetical protein
MTGLETLFPGGKEHPAEEVSFGVEILKSAGEKHGPKTPDSVGGRGSSEFSGRTEWRRRGFRGCSGLFFIFPGAWYDRNRRSTVQLLVIEGETIHP